WVAAGGAGRGGGAAVERRAGPARRQGGGRGEAAGGAAEGSGPRRDGQTERDIHRAGKADIAEVRAGECRIGAERDRVVVALRAGGRDGPTVERRRARRVRRQRRE